VYAGSVRPPRSTSRERRHALHLRVLGEIEEVRGGVRIVTAQRARGAEHGEQTVRVSERYGTQQRDVGDTEDRRGDGDAECQTDDRRSEQQRRAAQCPPRV
jgi:hypothetical protein